MRAALVILGATGGIGRGVVRAALERGHPVVAVARHVEALDELALEHRGAELTTLPGSVGSDAEGAVLANRLRDLGRPVAGIVASVCGGTSNGRILDQPAAFLRHKLDEGAAAPRRRPAPAAATRRGRTRQLPADRRPRQRTPRGRLRPSLDRRGRVADARPGAARRGALDGGAGATADRRRAGLHRRQPQARQRPMAQRPGDGPAAPWR